jgi:xylose isomerase
MADFIPRIRKITYEGPGSRNPLAFKHYNPVQKVLGKPMKDHLRFAVAYWHTFRGTGADPFGSQTLFRPWDDGTDSLANAQRRMRVCFEFAQKLGAEYYCFHDRDIAPEGRSLAESHRNLDAVVRVARKLQRDTGIRLLWGTANLFSNPRYMCGASTNPEELGGKNFVFWGGREGYQTFLNTDMKREIDHMARFLHMAADYKREIGFKGTLLIEPKPKEPTKHQYDFDAATVIGFLRAYGLERDFKLNIENNHATLAAHAFEHDLQVASDAGMLGSIDANVGDSLLGWDTDQYLMDTKTATLAMAIVLRQGGLQPGGLNFDAKVRRESIDVEDLFLAHIGSMDTFALGLKNAARLVKSGVFDKLLERRYSGYDRGIGARIEKGRTSFAELEKWVMQAGEPKPRSGKQEKCEIILRQYTG